MADQISSEVILRTLRENLAQINAAVDEQEAVKIIHAALDSGITLVDTAASYGAGRSENIVGEALKGRRDKVVLSTKGGAHFNPAINNMDHDLSAAAIRHDVDESLSRLKTDYIDLFFFHYPDPNTPIAESIGTMEELRKEGKIRMIGLSNYWADVFTGCILAGAVMIDIIRQRQKIHA